MKLYTRKGDQGRTQIWGGVRVDKSSLRVEALGQVDACSAALGVALAAGPPPPLDQQLATVQDDLYLVGCDLMAPSREGSGASVPRISPAAVEVLEGWIDELVDALPPLRNFIHPGGSLPASYLHVARATGRTAERRVDALAAEEPVSPVVQAYLNRLADYLFAAARHANHAVGQPEPLARVTG